MNTTEKLADVRRRFANAKKRAKYWAGAPSFSKGGGHSMTRLAIERLAAKGTDHELEYEMAMADCSSLADEIERIAGIRPAIPEYR